MTDLPKVVNYPEVVVVNDFDGYFARLVDGLIERHEGDFKHKTIRITAGPWRPYAVDYHSDGETITLDFYSALRAGFGSLSDEDLTELSKLL